VGDYIGLHSQIRLRETTQVSLISYLLPKS